MTKKNTRNARYLLSSTLGGPYTAVNLTHGLKLGLQTDWAEATVHGATYKEYIGGLKDFSLTVLAYYDTIATTLEVMAANGISEFFLLYHDFADPLNYWRGQCFLGFNEQNLDLGNTVEDSFSARIANSDIQLVRAGAVV